MALQETPMTLMGQKTPRASIYKHESHKLHQAFPVKVTDSVAEKIVKGQPVKLNTDGTISPYNGSGIYLGIAVTDSINPAYAAQRNYPMEVTVMMEGFAIVNWVSGASQITAGYVNTDGSLLNGKYVKATNTATSGTTPSNFIAITTADEVNEVIQVLVK